VYALVETNPTAWTTRPSISVSLVPKIEGDQAHLDPSTVVRNSRGDMFLALDEK